MRVLDELFQVVASEQFEASVVLDGWLEELGFIKKFSNQANCGLVLRDFTFEA